jgi:transcriptional regulator GlxA family with amidase domain
MADTHRPIETVVIGVPWASASVTYSILDVLASVGRDWEMLHGAPTQPPRFAARHLSLDGEVYEEVNGRKITPEGRLDTMRAPDLVIVPDLHVDPTQELPEVFGPIADWMRAAHTQGAILTSVCSGAMLLAETGLLDGEEATTHWGFSDAIARRHPNIRLRRERILVPAGEGHRIITAGGASAWGDLMLYLITRVAGADEARRIAKVYLIEPHTQGQMCYASLSTGRQHEDQIVGEAQAWAAMNYEHPSPVQTMAQMSDLSERSFLRRFRRATGQSPLAYIQTIRVEEAKQMLETTTTPIDDIAAEVGYSEPSSFRAAFRKHVGVPASAYRKKWRGAS